MSLPTEHAELDGPARQLTFGSGRSVVTLLVLMALVGWIVILSGRTIPTVHSASSVVREQILSSIYAHGEPAVSVLVLANDPHRATVCMAGGKARFFEERPARWNEIRSAMEFPWEQTLLGFCPYVP